jgi:hypothetical protein
MRDPLVSSNDPRARNSHDGSACQRAQKCQWNKWHRTVQWRSGSRPSKGDIHIIATLTTVRDLLFGDVVYCNRYTEILGHVLGRGTSKTFMPGLSWSLRPTRSCLLFCASSKVFVSGITNHTCCCLEKKGKKIRYKP